jgi:lipopolysaccharide/colanic/teichoic acid biosynthesis glycosyltransferase
MPTNYQTQVKMTPTNSSSRVELDSVPLAPSADGVPAPITAKRHTSPNVLGYPPAERRQATTETKQAVEQSARAAGRRADSRGYAFSKRLFDITLGSVMFVVAVPIVLVAAAVIRFNSPGSPFFFQTRLGRNGKPFTIFKLRGMYIDARARFPSYYDYSCKRDLEFCFHHEEDPRVTPAGRFIRKTSIDELPNLWNVVLGDMSLVGPRPEKPGVTGLSKCTGRDRLTKRETIEFDIDYIRKRSFSLDFKILWRTIRAVVLRRDVF